MITFELIVGYNSLFKRIGYMFKVLLMIPPLQNGKGFIVILFGFQCKSYTDEEIVKMIEAYDFRTHLNARNKLMIAMFADTGIRMTVLINLQSSWIHDTSIKILGKGSK